MSAEDILLKQPPPPDKREAYGGDPNQFVDIRVPAGKGPHPILINLHGGFWRSKYDLGHAGHLCHAMRNAGMATFNVEYRRVGNEGGGWPGTFADIRSAYRYVRQEAQRYEANVEKLVVIGHSAGGQLSLCLAAYETSLMRVISLAGVTDMQKGFSLHLSHDAVAEFLGGKPEAVPEHYREADPMKLRVEKARQWLIHGGDDDTVPVEFSRDYSRQKKSSGENVELVEIPHCGHFELIDPSAAAFKQVAATVLAAVA